MKPLIGASVSQMQQPQSSMHMHRYACNTCKDSGAVLARDKIQGGAPYAFRCQCYRGENSGRAYPRWNSRMNDAYEVQA